MKFKTTQKTIKVNYNTIICIPYCGLQNLLNYESPVAYTVRREGWAADIYDMGGGERYETDAEKIRYNYSLAWEERREQLKQLARAFIKEVTRHE